MRPVTLELSAFGSYPMRERVDFGAMAADGLFVVTGPTGAGKSTLFDAMTYALYGAIPGERGNDLAHVRSHHAEPGSITSVTLTFETSEGRFRVHREARHDRRKLSGSGTVTVNPKAALYRITAAPSGDEIEPVVSGVQEVTARCVELVGLTAAQFQRVVLLPQGKCAAFLLADTDSRRTLLQQLFGTHQYQRAIELAHDLVRSLQGAVGERAVEIDHHRRSAAEGVTELAVLLGVPPPVEALASDDIDAIATCLDVLVPLVEDHRAATVDAEHSADAATECHRRAARAAERWDVRAELRRHRHELDSDEPVIETASVEFAAAVRARPVISAAAACDRARAMAGETANALGAAWDGVLAESTQGGLALRVVDGARRHRRVDGLVAALTTQHRLLDTQLEQASALADATRTVADRECELDVAESARAELDAAAAALAAERDVVTARHDHVAPLAHEVDERTRRAREAAGLLDQRRHLDALTTQLVVNREAAASAGARYRTVMAAFLDGVAPQLADTLVDGEPCPVCGSSDHPAPARPVEGDGATTKADVASARQRRDVTSDALFDIGAQLDEQRRQLGAAADTDADELDRAAAATRCHRDEAAAAEDELVQLGTLLNGLDKRRAAGEERLAVARERVASERALLESARDTAELLRRRTVAIDVAAATAQRGHVERAQDIVIGVADLERRRDVAVGAVDQALTQLQTEMTTQGFEHPDEAQRAARDDATLAAFDRRIMAWHQARAGIVSRLTALGDHGADALPHDRPDVATLDHARTSADSDAARRRALQERLQLRLSDSARHTERARRLDAALAEDRQQLHDARLVFETCNGNNSARVQLETWVLASELDRVTMAANAHLARITRHRYTLERREPDGAGRGRSGLDLVVNDAETGRSRPPATLSGGEQFQASLALALGLADVVSQGGTSTGKVYEALFVDEGFGSLDANALDEAVDALDDLRSTGRMVGVITHVEALKRQLPVGIEVIRRPGGGSTVSTSAQAPRSS